MSDLDRFVNELCGSNDLQGDLVALGKKRGFTFTPAEVKAFAERAKGALSDSELDSVAGGWGGATGTGI